MSDDDFRCAAASRRDGEPMVGTAPSDERWLFVEYAGAWGRKAVPESRLPPEVVEHLGSLTGVRVQLIRRHGGEQGPGVRVFAARLGPRPEVTTVLLDDVRDLPTLDPTALTAYAAPLWLVCTNGRRDVCCAEAGRPVAAALAVRWPEATWETTHLGGHRFAGTLLALPSGVTLGRVDPESAVEACALIERGSHPTTHSRGTAGLLGAAQVAELHVRERLGLDSLEDVVVERTEGDTVTVRTPTGRVAVGVSSAPGEPRRQSCADLTTKPAPEYVVRSWVQVDQ